MLCHDMLTSKAAMASTLNDYMAWTINQIQRATQQYVYFCGMFNTNKEKVDKHIMCHNRGETRTYTSPKMQHNHPILVYAIHNTLYLYTIHYTPYIMHHTLNTIKFILYTLHYTLHTLNFILCTLYFKLYTLF